MEALGINVPGLIGQIVSFIILLVLLSKFAYRPIINMLDQRAERIRESLEAAESVRREANEAEQRLQVQMDTARQEGQVLIAQAERLGEQIKESARQEARQETETIMKRARAEIQVERETALAALRREFADIAILAAEKVINESLDKERHKRLIDDVLEESPLLRRQ